MDRAVQLEWIFMQHMSKDTGQSFMGWEMFLWENVLPCIFFGKPKPLPPIIGTLSKLPVNKSEMVLQNLMTSSKEKYTSLIRESGNLIGGVRGERVFKLPIKSGQLNERSSTVNNIIFRKWRKAPGNR